MRVRKPTLHMRYVNHTLRVGGHHGC